MPLMLQVGFGYPALIAGCMMAPTALGSIIAKSTVTQVLRRLGYRKTLVSITVFIGLMIAQFSFPISRHADLDARTARYSFLEWRCPLNLRQ
ncbi:Inner membrane transport protein YieO [Salmonella enterica subsp. enterica]|uniref:Inner membrane transport protein YieO n=1 Tax=Salmonella enterica I TaxID=59201 RepID=A0A447N169_SALET|nr:Inner membrane transport protein YieO [Salmonella enterica subsp. enterica]